MRGACIPTTGLKNWAKASPLQFVCEPEKRARLISPHMHDNAFYHRHSIRDTVPIDAPKQARKSKRNHEEQNADYRLPEGLNAEPW